MKMTDLTKNLQMLIDGDWLLYLCCNAVEYNWQDHEDYEVDSSPPFEFVQTVAENKIDEWKFRLQTKVPPILCFSGADNFRKGIAKSKTYKGNRSSEKPFHYYNLKAYLEVSYSCEEHPRLEADDLMAILQTDDTIIVTVDKDLRQVNGWHYSPEGWNFGEFGPLYVTDDNSYIQLSENKKKITGTGYKFYWSQVITGDTIDNIPGLPGKGPSFAYQLLKDCDSEEECYNNVLDAYKDNHLCAVDIFNEQRILLYMLRSYEELERYNT